MFSRLLCEKRSTICVCILLNIQLSCEQNRHFLARGKSRGNPELHTPTRSLQGSSTENELGPDSQQTSLRLVSNLSVGGETCILQRWSTIRGRSRANIQQLQTTTVNMCYTVNCTCVRNKIFLSVWSMTMFVFSTIFCVAPFRRSGKFKPLISFLPVYPSNPGGDQYLKSFHGFISIWEGGCAPVGRLVWLGEST